MLVPATSSQWTSVSQSTTKEKFLWKWLKTFQRHYIIPEKSLLKKVCRAVLWICSAQTLNIFFKLESNFRWKTYAHFTKNGLGFHSITFVLGATRMFLIRPGSLYKTLHYICFFSVNISLPYNKAGLNRGISALAHRQTTLWKLSSFLHEKEKFQEYAEVFDIISIHHA